MMKLHLFNYVCGSCGFNFQSGEFFGDFTYGEFLLRSEGLDSQAYLSAFNDAVFDEVSKLVDNSFFLKNKSELDISNIFQEIYGVTCDPDLDGTYFKIGLDPKCPKCKKRIMASWSLTEPPIFIEKNVPSVTHSFWNLLSQIEKQKLVNDAIKEALLS